MAVPVVEAFTSNSSDSASSLELTKPSGVAVDDLLVVLLASDDGTTNQNWTTHSGWTLEFSQDASGEHIGMFYRVATGSEAASETVSKAGGADVYIGWYLRISGVNTTTPIDVDGAGSSTFSNTTHSITGVTTTQDDVLAFYLLVCNADATTFSVSGTGWSESDEIGVATGSAGSACWGTKSQTTAGATGTATVTSTASSDSEHRQFGIAPSAAAGSVIPAISHHDRMRRS